MQVSIIPCASVFVVIVTSWYFYRKHKQNVLRRNGIDGPPEHWIWGNLHEISTDGEEKPFKEWRKKYGRIFSWYVGTRRQVTVTDIELLSLIQVKEFDNFYSRGFHQVKGEFEVAPDHSLISESVSLQRWRQQRALLSPAFSSAKLKQTVPMINDALDTMFRIIEEQRVKLPDGDLDIYSFFQGLTMDTIGRSAFGVETKTQENPNDPFLKRAKEIFDDRIWYPSMVPFLLSLIFPEVEPLMYYIRRFVFFFTSSLGFAISYSQTQVALHIIKQRMADKRLARNDLLQQMVDAITESNELGVPKLTLEEAASNSFVFFEAGYETTSTLLGDMAHVLVSYPEVQEKLRDEVTELWNNEGNFGYNTLKLPYMEAVMNECLRMYPPITGFVTRRVEKDYKYKNITIPKGSNISVSVFLLHHDPEYWPEPETFDPERWMGERKKDIKPLAFQPFGYGPRLCIGMRFALLEAKMAIASLLMKYRLEVGPNTRLGDKFEFQFKPLSMTPKHGVFVKLVPL